MHGRACLNLWAYVCGGGGGGGAGRLSSEAYYYMLRSAADSHYNTLRVWGGGIFYHDIVYDTADELGLLLYHDAMYGQPWFGGNSGVPVRWQQLSPVGRTLAWYAGSSCTLWDAPWHGCVHTHVHINSYTLYP